MLGDDSLGLHLGQDSAAGGEEVAGGSVSHRFDPDRVGVNVNAHYLVVVAAAGALTKLAGLIRVQGIAGVVNVEEDFFLLNGGRSFFCRFGSTWGVCITFVFYNLCRFGCRSLDFSRGVDALALVANVALLGRL